jgi:SAM-dependent methyltransferase
MEAANEYSTAISYYRRFHRKRNRLANEPETKPLSQPWKEDTWTSVDEDNAEQILQNQIEKCTISNILKADEKITHKETEDANAWDQFYSNHGNRFFKDRHYFEKAFPNEFPPSSATKSSSNTTSLTTATSNDCEVEGRTLVEIGCGVGNAILPLLEAGESEGNWDVIHGLDISSEAIHILRKDERFVSFNETGPATKKTYGHVCDISRGLPPICSGISDVTTLIFCLSAIDPARQMVAAKHVVDSLKPGGVLVFRDYGRYDEAQMKLGTSRSKRIKDNFYRKHDGTKCYYFVLKDLEQIFCDHLKLKALELKYLRRVYGNKATTQVRRRIWVQGRFRKSLDEEESAN